MDYDSTAVAALDQNVIIKPRWYAWLDVLGDPLRATTGPASVAFPSNTPDADLAGQTFVAYNPDLVDVSEVTHSSQGGSTMSASLSGLIIPDNTLLNIIGNPVNWQGRIARFWMGVHNQAGVQQGAVTPWAGGFMSSLEILGVPGADDGTPGTQTISVTIESFTASWSRGSGRTYMDQKKYDAGDLSPDATLSTANGAHQTTPRPGGSGPAVGGGGGGGGSYGSRIASS